MGFFLTVGGYLLGSCLPAVWIVKRRTGKVPWELGDNPGGSGVWRLAGPVAGVLTVVLDVLKGILPVFLAHRAGLLGFWFVAVTCSPVIGHNWPLFTGFRGGRGFASATGILLYLSWWEMVPAYLAGVAVGFYKKWVPAVGVVAFPLGLLLMYIRSVSLETVVAAFCVMLLVAVRQVPWVVGKVGLKK